MAARSYSYSMPIRSYVLFIGPALLAGLWFIGSALEPTKAPQSGAPDPAVAKATLASPAQAAPPAVTAPAPSMQAVRDATAPSPPVRDPQAANAASTTPPPQALEPAATTASSLAAGAPSQAMHPVKHKKRKQIARRQHRDSNSPVYAERSEHAGYAARYSYDYPSSSPFSGFRAW